MSVRNLVPVVALLSLAGCATMANGRNQVITITSTPPGAACVIDELGAAPGDHVDVVNYTPGAITVKRARKQLKVTCALQGYPTTQVVQSYGISGNEGVNVLNGVIIGTLVDNNTGALYRYPSELHVDLIHAAPVAPAARAISAAPRTRVTPTPLAPLAAPPHS